MKPSLQYALSILALIIVVSSCEKADPPVKEPNKINLTKKSAEIIEADKAFGFELFREVCRMSSTENIMISPMSVSYALGMTYNGAADSTLEAFRKVLHFEGLTEEEVNESYKDLMDQLLTLDSKVQFSLANSIWYRMGFEVLDAFIQTNRQYFNAEVLETDFQDPGTLEAINQWIEDHTNGKIREMLDYIPGDAVMYLINAIYFDAKWKYEFDKSQTYSGDFRLEGGTTSADFMMVSGDFNYTVNEDFTAVELPYGDSAFSMVVMLPSETTGITGVVEKMTPEQWDAWFEGSWYSEVQVELPKFKYGFKDLLNDPLINLGLGVAFYGDADFTRISPAGNLYISRVIHQSFIDVQEEGTEAAAATIVEIRNESAAVEGPVLFRVDRPFLYAIKENSTGAIVFIGKVGNPEYDS